VSWTFRYGVRRSSSAAKTGSSILSHQEIRQIPYSGRNPRFHRRRHAQLPVNPSAGRKMIFATSSMLSGSHFMHSASLSFLSRVKSIR